MLNGDFTLLVNVWMVVELKTHSKKVESLETQVQKLKKEKRDLSQGKLLFIQYNN